jgi:hypothetical protein
VPKIIIGISLRIKPENEFIKIPIGEPSLAAPHRGKDDRLLMTPANLKVK